MGCFSSKPSNYSDLPTSKSSEAQKGKSQPTQVKHINLNVEAEGQGENGSLDAASFLDEYQLDYEIGRGGFSLVHKAVNKKTGESFAVKIIQKSLLQDDIKLLRREIAIMKKVSHKNILRLHQIYEDDEKVYIVMELVQGSELFNRIVEKGYYSEKNAINIVTQILSAVAYLHEIGIAHRDLKPENLLCAGSDEDEVVKIADFGLSKIFNDEEELRTSCGTPGYVAPEVLVCESYDKSVDLWTTGTITYVLLAGYPPFYADNDAMLFEKIINVDYDFEDECWDDVSDLAKDFIRHLLVRDPVQRWTAEQALNHPWLKSEASDKQLKIKRKMSEYNKQLKENRNMCEAARDDAIIATPF